MCILLDSWAAMQISMVNTHQERIAGPGADVLTG